METGGMSEGNVTLLGKVGEQLPKDMAKVIGADWNCEPKALVQTGFAHRVGTMIAAPKGKTCFTAAATTRLEFSLHHRTYASSVKKWR